MAIYHFSAKIISRGAGRSAVAAAAYRAASRLHDERLGRHHDFTNKAGVVHSEVMLPEGAPERLRDRTTLWNEVEAVEKRKDAQLAREVEFAIPREMTNSQAIALARDFVSAEFTSRGMIADLNVHWDIGADGEAKPHAHVMLTLRDIGSIGFGPKRREWNATALLEAWRESWAAHVNARCAELGIEARIDHRSYERQRVGLEPQHKIGAAGARRDARGEEAERADDHREIARRNGIAIIADPVLGLETLTRNQATFTIRDLAMFAHRQSDGQEQFDRVFASMRHHGCVIALGRDGRGAERFTTANMISSEELLTRDAARLAAPSHAVSRMQVRDAIDAAGRRGLILSDEQKIALEHVTGRSGLRLAVGYAGVGKSAMLGVAREAWEASGFGVRGTALSGIAAENLEGGSGIASRTIASLEHGWARGYDRLTSRDVLVIDEAGMIGTRQLQRLLGAAADARAKVVMVGDVQQLQAIEAGAAFRLLAERHGAAELGEVRRQSAEWMRAATRDFACGRSAEALAVYAKAGMVHAAATRAEAREALIEQWDNGRRANPAASRMILTHLTKEVQKLNEAARFKLAARGELGEDVLLRTERGLRRFADNDRIIFLKNDRDLWVKNGTLATIEQATSHMLAARLDDGRRISFDLKNYAHVDHGYAATIHKSQGVTVDHAHVLATPGLDAHSSYVALSRHRGSVALHYGRDDFADSKQLGRTLGRQRPKDMALDYSGSGRSGRNAEAQTGAGLLDKAIGGKEDPARSDRANYLRAMVAAHAAAPKPTSATMREALAKAAAAATGLVRTRGRDNGAER